jgi:hypothetical protein
LVPIQNVDMENSNWKIAIPIGSNWFVPISNGENIQLVPTEIFNWK